MWDLIVSVPDHCLSFYFTILKQCFFYETVRNRRLLLALTENGLGLDSVSLVYQGQKFIVP